MNTSSASLPASESTGFFGAYGGQFVPDDLKARLDEVTEAFDRYSDNSFFKDELDYYFKHYTGRPNPIFFCANLSERLGRDCKPGSAPCSRAWQRLKRRLRKSSVK